MFLPYVVGWSGPNQPFALEAHYCSVIMYGQSWSVKQGKYYGYSTFEGGVLLNILNFSMVGFVS